MAEPRVRRFGKGVRTEEGIEVHHNAKKGELHLWCGVGSFAAIRDAVIAQVGIEDVIGESRADLRSLVIDQIPKRKLKPRPLAFLIAVSGALVAAILMFVFVVGVLAIAGWIF